MSAAPSQQNMSNKLSMENFPDDIILHIFSFLRKSALCLGARLTCTRWCEISKDATLWKTVTIPIHFTDQRLMLLMEQVGHHIEELDCSQCEVLSTAVFLKLKDISCSEAQYANMKKLFLPVEPTDSVEYDNVTSYFTEFSKIFPYLENIENMTSVSGTLNALECQSMFPNLQVLNDKPVNSFGRISEVVRRGVQQKKDSWVENMKKLAKSCKNIQEYRCTKGMGYIDVIGLPLIGSLFPNLEVLELRLCSLNDDSLAEFYNSFKVENDENDVTKTNTISEIIFEKPGVITDKGLDIIARNSPNLKKVKLSRCCDITDKGIDTLVSHCKGIVSLHLNTSRGWGADSDKPVCQIDDDCIHHITENCTSLQILRVLYSTKITYKSMTSLLHNCPILSALMLFECPAIDDKALAELAKIPFLKRLVLVNTSVLPKGVLHFILDAPNLTCLTLYCSPGREFYSDMTALGEEIYQSIDEESSHYRPNSLSSLTLRGIGSGFLQLITVLSPNLLSLDIRENIISGITTSSLHSVLTNCELLEQFDLSSLAEVKPSILKAIAQSAKHLRKLSLGSNIKSYENKDFDCVIQQCPSMEMISMDTYDSKINEVQFVDDIKKYHGGYCYLHVDKECETDPEFKHRFTSFHFMPSIYV